MKRRIVVFTPVRLSAGFAIIVALLGSGVSLLGQAQSDACPPAALLREALWQSYRPLQPPAITVSLTNPVLPDQNKNATWLLIDNTDRRLIPLKESVDYNLIGGRYALSATIVPDRPLAVDHLYYLMAQGIVYQGCPGPTKSVASINVPTEPPKGAKRDFKFSAATGRSDSDFYFALTIDGTSEQKASYTLDTKFQFRKSLLAPQFGRGVPYRPAIFLIPGWDLTFSSNPKEDGNSVNFVVPAEVVVPVDPTPFPTLSKVITGIISQPGFVFEADKTFDNLNGVLADYEYLLLRGFGGDKIWVSPQPTIGFETGSNLKALKANTYPASIIRGDFGVRIGLDVISAKAKSKPLFSIDVDYIRRLLLHPEPTYAPNAQGNLQLTSVGTHPRGHVTVKINYNLVSYAALTATYEYGELPPVYTKVDNKYTFGVTFLGQLQYRPGAKAK